MILTFADLLEAFKAKQTADLDQQPIVHGPTIGSMYEGLTRAMLTSAVFEGLDLRVVQGIITGVDGRQSDTMDCMLVEGEARQLPHSDSYIYPLNQVVAIVQVKKNLYASHLASAFQNLRSVVDIFDFDAAVGGQEFRDAWRQIMGAEPPGSKEHLTLSFEEQILYNTLLFDSLLPLRIVMGYHGFSTEYALREAFSKYIGSNATFDPNDVKTGFGPLSFPSLVLCGPHALVKGNGMPFGAPLTHSRKWRIMGSVSGISMRLLLELIWTRLSYRYKLGSSMFGDDLVTEVMAPLVLGKPSDQGDMRGWLYDYIQFPKSTLEAGPKEALWEPVVLTEDQFHVFSLLVEREQPISVDTDPDYLRYIDEKGLIAGQFLPSLLETRLLYLDHAGNLWFLTDECVVARLPDGRIVAGENNSGRLLRWVKQFEAGYRLARDRDTTDQ